MEDKESVVDKNRKMNSIRAFVTLITVLIFAILLDSAITFFVLRRNTERSTGFLLTQLDTIIENNKKDEDIQLAEQKLAYTSAAQAAAYIIYENPEVAFDIDELKNVASSLAVDEINIFDKSGTIVAGTNPEYYGLNLDSGEQVSFFEPMLTNKSLTMCQDLVPNTATHKKMMYAATWDKSETMIVQVGIEPKRLLAVLRNHEINSIISNMTLEQGYSIYAINPESESIVGSSETKILEKELSELYGGRLAKVTESKNKGLFRYNGKTFYCNSRLIGQYLIVVSLDTSYSTVYFVLPIVIIAAYLLVAGFVILGLFAKLQQKEEETEVEFWNNYNDIMALNNSLKENNETITKQYNVLKSMSEIYYSMHLIDLLNDTAIAYNEQGKVAEIVNKSTDATQMMIEIMDKVIAPSYKKDAMEFTDLTTLPERMKGKKSISKELVGLNIGWFVATFIAVETDSEEYPTKVILTTRWIDDEKKKEEKLLHDSNTDGLTGLFNRRGYEDAIKKYEQNELEDNFVYASFDVNGLKRINDTFGHDAGDELIIGASECMKRIFTPYGRLFRTGGDEFVALLKVDAKSAERLFDKFRTETSLWKSDVIDELAVSVGYVTREEARDLTLHEIAILADKRMYEAKAMHYQLKGIERR